VQGYLDLAVAEGGSFACGGGRPAGLDRGYYVEPTAQSVAVALLSAQIDETPTSPTYLQPNLVPVYNSTDKRAYPMSSYSYMIVPTATTDTFSADKGKTLGAFAYYFLCEGQQQAPVLGYSPLQTALAFAPLVVPVTVLSGFSFWYLPKLGLRVMVFLGLSIMAVGFLSMRRLGLDSSYPDLAGPLLVLSTGIGLCTAPTTAAIMSAVPDEKQGVASAVNDTARELGAALGIAIAGSMLAAQYTRSLTPRLMAFPEPLRGPAAQSLATAIAVSHRLGEPGAQLADVTRTAFLHSMQASLFVMAVIMAAAAVVVGVWSPGRDGTRLRPVRWLTSRRPVH